MVRISVENFSTFLISLVSVYGIVLTIYTIRLKRQERQRTLTVRIMWAYQFDYSREMISVTVANPGYIPVTVNSIYIKLPDGKSLILPAPVVAMALPYDLEPGKSCVSRADLREITGELVRNGYTGKLKIRGAATDGIGTVYLSKKQTLDIPELSRRFTDIKPAEKLPGPDGLAKHK